MLFPKCLLNLKTAFDKQGMFFPLIQSSTLKLLDDRSFFSKNYKQTCIKQNLK